MSLPLVTIGIPAFKAQYLEECLCSAMTQKYAAIDLVVVDDFSTDPIGPIVERVGRGRIRYYRNQENVGRDRPVRNWNRCLSFARGEWFCLLGDDDLYLPEFINRAMAAAAADPGVDVVRTGIKIIDEAGVATCDVIAQATHEDWLTFLWERTCNGRTLFASENLIRTSSLRRLGGYVDFPAAWCSDDATLLALSHAGGIANVREPLVCWRNSATNLSATATVHSKLSAIESYHRWLDARLTQWANAEPQVRERGQWRAILAHLSMRWSDLRVDALRKSWGALGEAIWQSEHLNNDYPRPTVSEIARSSVSLIKRSLYDGLFAYGEGRRRTRLGQRQTHMGRQE